MAEFRRMIVTDKGRNLIAKLLDGASGVQFTRLALSSTTYSDSQIPALTSVSNVKQSVSVSKTVKLTTAAIKLEGAITNENLTTGYTLNSIAVYAADPDEGEILYSVAGASTAGYVPPYNGITVSGIYLTVTTTVSNADNVNLTVDPAATATIGDVLELEKQISDLQAFVGYTDSDIYGVEVDFVNKKFTRLAGAVGKTPGEPFNSVNAFGGRKRCNLTNEGVVVAYYGDPGYSETGKLTKSVDLNPDDAEEPDPELQFSAGTVVQAMVEQPRFYYKVVPLKLEKIAGGVGYHMRKARYYICDTPKAGFKLHPAFVVDGVEKEKIYLSAFDGCLWDASSSAYILNDDQVASFINAVGTGDMLSSIANAKPISGLTQNLTRANARTLVVLCDEANDYYVTDHEYAALEISYIAIDRRVQGNGIGTRVLARLISDAEKLSKILPIRFLVLDALDDKVQWYLDAGFTTYPKREDLRYADTVPMRIDLIDTTLTEKYVGSLN